MSMETFVHRWSAMATYFEIALWGRDRLYLETVAEEAEVEVANAEQMLSRYRESSDLHELNARAAHETIYTDPRLFGLLLHATRLTVLTKGAFDITVAPLVNAWGFAGASGHAATESELAAAMQLVGPGVVLLDEETYGVRFARAGAQLDLGAIGKGYAVDRVRELAREREVPGCLVHGGTSTIGSVGTAPDGLPWRVQIGPPPGCTAELPVVHLSDAALSVSAPHGKGFHAAGKYHGHVLNPRTGRPTAGALLAAVVSPSATEADAFSTALLVGGEELLPTLLSQPGTGALLVLPTDRAEEVHVLNRLGAHTSPPSA